MEAFLWTAFAALLTGIATIAWSNPSFFTGVLLKFLFGAMFFAQIVFQIWDIAISFMMKKVGEGFPDIQTGKLLTISQNAKIPDNAWIIYFGLLFFLLALIALAFAKSDHDRKASLKP